MSIETGWAATADASELESDGPAARAVTDLAGAEAADQISLWLRDYLAALLELQPGDVDDNESFARFGLDSAATIAMLADLGEWLGHELDATLAYDHPSIRDLSRTLACQPQIRARLTE